MIVAYFVLLCGLVGLVWGQMMHGDLWLFLVSIVEVTAAGPWLGAAFLDWRNVSAQVHDDPIPYTVTNGRMYRTGGYWPMNGSQL